MDDHLVQLLLAYNLSRHEPAPTAHEQNVAFLTDNHLRVLNLSPLQPC